MEFSQFDGLPGRGFRVHASDCPCGHQSSRSHETGPTSQFRGFIQTSLVCVRRRTPMPITDLSPCYFSG